MAEIDPYAVLGVSRTATRDEIARAYRSLAKRTHPDTGAPGPRAMARINEAWRILSDPVRRARWDGDHRPVVPIVPPHWAAVPPEPPRRPVAPATPATPSVQDSGWLAIGVVASVTAVVVAVMAIVAAVTASGAPDVGPSFTSDEVSFRAPPEWQVAAGEDDSSAPHRVIAHAVTFSIEGDRMCTAFDGSCPLTMDEIPPGEASIIITAWEGGTPRVADPVRSRPAGLDAARVIGGAPAAYRLERSREAAVAWWQLSPPGFPDRWIEVRADVRGRVFDQDAVLSEIEAVLATLTFGE